MALVLSKINHSPDSNREHRENILFQEVNRISVSSPLCPLNYQHYPEVSEQMRNMYWVILRLDRRIHKLFHYFFLSTQRLSQWTLWFHISASFHRTFDITMAFYSLNRGKLSIHWISNSSPITPSPRITRYTRKRPSISCSLYFSKYALLFTWPAQHVMFIC